ncbi:unnamed protein product [Plutella xylostella]|uniref:(diamondback moth) hypothetical protein n=1 Tax=Plutella xylostella TaxID=51655 RepID=A0A8S4FCD0_PLUXY|nr:unnamed protein product [Plutella xylostella]
MVLHYKSVQLPAQRRHGPAASVGPPSEPPAHRQGAYKRAPGASATRHSAVAARLARPSPPKSIHATGAVMRAAGTLLVLAAALLAGCGADSHQEQGMNGHGDRFDSNDAIEAQEVDDLLRFLVAYENSQDYGRNINGIGGSSLLGRNINGIGGSSLLGRNINGIGGSSLLGRNINGIGGSSLLGRNINGIGGSSLLGRNINGIGGSSLLGRNINGIGGSSLLGRNINGIGGSSLLGRDVDDYQKPKRFIDSLGGGNFVRNLDSIGGGNLVKKNLDALGGPNLIKRTLDSLGGGNLVRSLDSIGGGNFVRQLDSIDHKTRTLDPAGGGRARPAREARPLFLFYNPYSGDLLPGFDSPASDRGKRNFDEIDRSGLDSFANKRSFDEIDNSMMPFPHTKRFLRYYRPTFLGAPE